MYNFIVLGLIPGTNIQIGFWAYVGLIVVAVALFAVIRHWQHHRSFEEIFPQRVLLHANQLHFRG